MKRDLRYILFLALALNAYIAVKLSGPRELDWTPTYSVTDKDPYGGYIFDQLLRRYFPSPSRHSYKTLYELKDSLDAGTHVLILAGDFSPGREDSEVILDHVARGGMAFIASHDFYNHFADTLGISTRDHLSDFRLSGYVGFIDSAYLYTAGKDSVRLPRESMAMSFSRFDSLSGRVLVRNDAGRPTALRLPWGKGQFILCSTPLLFTNYYLVQGNIHRFASAHLAPLPSRPVYRLEFYQLGRMEARTPLRFILSQPSLRWAYYLCLGGLAAFMIFEVRRKQRIIPVLPPLRNASLEFVGTVGNLYYQHGDHADVARKKINYFLNQVRSQYYLDFTESSHSILQQLAGKTGRPVEEVSCLWEKMEEVKRASHISKETLLDLNRRIEQFQSKLYSKT
jgi:hypothetical protein